MKTYSFVLLMFLLFSQGLAAQIVESSTPVNDSVEIDLAKSPVKASVYSAVLPGAGQIYNGKIWKAPVVWVGMGAFGYFAYTNNQQFLRYKNAYLYRQEDGIDEFYGILTNEGLINEMDRYRRFRDLNIIGATLFYVLQIVDANVDASLSDFDVSDDLSLRFGVSNYYQYNSAPPVGLSLSLRF